MVPVVVVVVSAKTDPIIGAIAVSPVTIRIAVRARVHAREDKPMVVMAIRAIMMMTSRKPRVVPMPPDNTAVRAVRVVMRTRVVSARMPAMAASCFGLRNGDPEESQRCYRNDDLSHTKLDTASD